MRLQIALGCRPDERQKPLWRFVADVLPSLCVLGLEPLHHDDLRIVILLLAGIVVHGRWHDYIAPEGGV
jgi:hypothetical protein